VNSYTGLHARVYDEIYADKPYADEARFVHELTGGQGGTLLDVACGTGRHALAFADLGYEVTGTDINEELLAVGRESAGEGVRFVQGDMRDLDVPGGPFDVVTCLFDSIGYAQENDRVVGALGALGRHVSQNGSVIVEFLHAPAIVRGADARRVRTIALADGRELTRVSETTLEAERMLMHVRYELSLDGETFSETQVNRAFSVPELRLLAETAGLEARSFVPAYADGQIELDTFHVLLAAGRAR
jgi:2-polyprenyl-3-methyl-5-hydroxy-6-metoxy-1,4-benzoquinol methylase